MRSTSRVTSRARQVGTVVPVVADLEAERLEHPAARPARSPGPRSVSSLGTEMDDRPLRLLGVHVALAGPAGVGQLREQLAAQARGVDGEMRVDALLPAAGGLGHSPSRSDVRWIRSAPVRRLEEHGGRLLCDLAVLAAMIPAIATGRSASAMRDPRASDSNRPVEGDLISSSNCARRTTMRPSASLDWSNAWSRLPSASIA